MKLLLFVLFPIFLNAQQLQPVTSVQADCGKFSTPIRTAGTFTTAIVDNRLAACDGWTVTYSSNGFATVSVLLQDAPLGAGGVAGTFVSFAGTIVAPTVNPATATTQGEIRATGYYPYVRVQITTTGTGYLQAEFHGFKTNVNSGGTGGGSGGCVGTSVTPCVVDGPTPSGSAATKPPVLIAGTTPPGFGSITETIQTDFNGGVVPANNSVGTSDGVTDASLNIMANGSGTYLYNFALPIVFNGSTWDRQFVCSLKTPVITLSDATRTVLVAASGATNIRICHIHFSTSGAAEEFTISTGTGSACGTGTAVIDDYLNTTAIAMDFQPTAALRGGASNAVCVTQSGGAQTAKVVAIYAQF
jgi:hypothetical protein